MKKSTFIGNFAGWVVVAAASVAFLAWYHMTDFEVVSAAIGDSALVQLGVVLASPLLLYAIGALIGLLLVWFKHLRMGRVARTVCLVLALLVLVFVLLAAVPALEQHDAQPLLEEVDLLDEGGRRDVERARRLGEASGVRGLDERLDMARVHGCPFA